MGLLTYVPLLLGFAGAALAGWDARLDPASRAGWAAASLLVGLAALPLWRFVGTALWGV